MLKAHEIGNKEFSVRLPGAARRRVPVSTDRLVSMEHLRPGETWPLVVTPALEGVDLVAWAQPNGEYIKEQLDKHGAILFKDFRIASVEQFEQFSAAAAGPMMEYKERSSPRTQVGQHTYTSTDYQADQKIFPHNEHSYACRFPRKLLFCCLVPAASGGETPIVNCRNVLSRMDSRVREKFERKGWMYVRNYGGGCGLTWEAAFQTSDKTAVEAYCRANRVEWEWRPDNQLRTRQVRPVTITHPRTGETVWFNHVTFFHVSTLPVQMREQLLAQFREEDLPNNTYYGDGSPIEPSVLDHLRELYLSEKVLFPWRQGDVLLLDNVLTAHARESYSGERRIVVTLADPFVRTDL